MKTLKPISLRLIFVVLSTAVMVFFSEKTYWYPQGYAIGELILFYAFPVYACLWAVDYFRVRRLSALILVAALFAFLVEGVLTPVIYEAGLLDPVMPAYFIGWHGLLSIVFGWYFVRRWLVGGQWQRLLIGSAVFGLFWGIWALTFWLPESFEEFANPGQWPVADFGLHALTFTLMLIVGHWLLGQGGWQKQFKMGRVEKWVLATALVFFFATLAFPSALLGILKLALLVTAVFLPLRANRQREPNGSLFTELTDTVQIRHLLPLLVMPVMATAVYGVAALFQLPEDSIRAIFELTPFAQSLIGAIVFVWAFIVTIRPSQMPKATAQGELT